MEIPSAVSRARQLVRSWIRFVLKRVIITKLTNPDKLVYLTFDDGPCANTEVLATALKRMHVPAGFFFNGDAVTAHKDLVRKIHSDGFYIGNHSFNHSRYPWHQWKKELISIKRGEDVIESITQRKCNVYRPPYGAMGLIAFLALAFKKYKIIYWSVDSRDFQAKNINDILENIRSTESGDILLFHSDADLTISEINRIIAELSGQGYRFGDLTSVLP